MFRVSDAIRCTQTQDGAVVLDVQRGRMFSLNLVGSRILEHLKHGFSEPTIVNEIAREFGVSPELAKTDVRGFVQELRQLHLIEEPKSIGV